MKTDELNHRFTYHPPKGDQPQKYEKIRESARLFSHVIAKLTPVSREQSLAIMKLEEAVFWANAAIARNE